MNLLAAIAAVPMLLLGVTTQAPSRPRVLVLGDSLTAEVRASPQASAWLSGADVDWAGTLFQSAPCNGLQAVRNLTYVPDVVVLNYAGNHGSFRYNCMLGETGPGLVRRYLADVGAIVRALRNHHTRIAIVGAPARFTADSEAVYDALHEFADERLIAWLDGGAELTPRRRLTRIAACLPIEQGSTCGSAGRPGLNLVRDRYLDHLCPGDIDVFGRCRRYSSGALRLGLQFVTAIASATVPEPLHRPGCPVL